MRTKHFEIEQDLMEYVEDKETKDELKNMLRLLERLIKKYGSLWVADMVQDLAGEASTAFHNSLTKGSKNDEM